MGRRWLEGGRVPRADAKEASFSSTVRARTRHPSTRRVASRPFNVYIRTCGGVYKYKRARARESRKDTQGSGYGESGFGGVTKNACEGKGKRRDRGRKNIERRRWRWRKAVYSGRGEQRRRVLGGAHSKEGAFRVNVFLVKMARIVRERCRHDVYSIRMFFKMTPLCLAGISDGFPVYFVSCGLFSRDI